MEERLKEQRNKLILRVTMILLGVWLAVFTTYCVIRLNNERADLQNRFLSQFSYAKQYISMDLKNFSNSDYIFVTNGNLIEWKDIMKRDFDSQIILIDPKSNEVLADTANKIRVVYTFHDAKGTYPDDYGYLDYPALRSSISDTQLERITGWLQTRRSDGLTYELVCSRFYCYRDNIIPLELSVMLTQDADDKFASENVVETFPLHQEIPDNAMVFENTDGHLNLIPKDFLLNGAYHQDYISMLTDEQREKSFDVIPVDTAEYILYTSEYYYANAMVFSSEKEYYERKPQIYLVQYAKKVNLLINCRSDLIMGAAVTFAFFWGNRRASLPDDMEYGPDADFAGEQAGRIDQCVGA